MSAEPFIAYEPPYGGQVLRVRSVAAAWDRVANFLSTCTDCDPARPESTELFLYEPRDDEPNAWYAPTLIAAESAFGTGTRRKWLSDGARGRFLVEWRLPPDAAEAARTFLEKGEPWPKLELGSAQLLLSFRFRWTDAATRTVLPGQTAEFRAHPTGGVSSLLLFLGRPTSLMLSAQFPFAEAGAEFRAYLESVAPRMPMQLLASRFRRWIPTRRPTELGYNVRRLEPSLLHGIAK